MKEHKGLVIEEFKGFWDRDQPDSCPPDHFSACNNLKPLESGLETRPGLDTLIAKDNVLRMYDFKTQTNEGLLILDNLGSIYHSLLDGSGTTYGPILTIPAMTDFGFQSYNGRAYITPFKTFTTNDGVDYQKGLQNEFVYVYKGDGTNARKAAGFPPTNATTTANQNFKSFNSEFDGGVTKGIHLVSVLFTSGVGDTLAIQVFPVIYAPGGKQIENIEIPIGPIGTTARKIVMTHAIDPSVYTSNQASYTYYVAATIADNTTDYLRINVADAALVTVQAMGVIPAVTGLLAENTNNKGFADLGFHLIAVVYETDTGYLTSLGPEVFAAVNVVDILKTIKVSNIPVSPDSFVTKRHLVSTIAIKNYNGDQTGYQFFFIPDGEIDDNTTTTKEVSYYDADLEEDASHLIDNFSEIPAGVTLKTYHGRMVLTTTFNDISVAYFSHQGEPEAFDQVDGVVIFPLDGLPITNAQEYRDVCYLYKKTRTAAVIDNGDDPSLWTLTILDQGVGASVHGIAQVLDSGGVNVDFILVMDYSGILLFDGAYHRPELTWKIHSFWVALDRNEFVRLEIYNDSLNKIIYVTIPSLFMIMCGFYDWGLDAENIRWWPWTFDIVPTTIALIETDILAIGSQGVVF